LAFLAAAVYAGINYKMLLEMRAANKTANDSFTKTLGQMQAQTTIARQQLVGTQAAIIEEPVIQIDTESVGAPVIQVVFQNRGHVTGYVSGSVDVIRVHRDGTEVTLNRGDFLNGPALAQMALVKAYPFIGVKSGFTIPEWENMRDLRFLTPRQFFVVKGKYSYNDGFDDIHADIPFCFSWLTHPAVTNSFGTGEGAGAGFQQCDRWEYLRKTKAEEMAHPYKRPNTVNQ
jgi:hypothetical protein